MDINLDEQPKVEQSLSVWSPPIFCEPPRNAYAIRENDRIRFSFAVCGNPKPDVKAQLTGPESDQQSIKVLRDSSVKQSPYKTAYNIQPIAMDIQTCTGRLTIDAKSYTTVTHSATVNLLFTPDVVTGVTAHRDDDDRLRVGWNAATYGNCRVRYHVRRTINGTATEVHITTATSYVFESAIHNNTVAVNVEVNDRQGAYSEPFFVPSLAYLATPEPAASYTDDGMGAGTIVGIVAGVVIVCLLLGLLLVASRKRILNLSDFFKSGMKDEDDEEQPFSFHAPVHTEGYKGDNKSKQKGDNDFYNRDKNKYNGDYVDVNNIVSKLREDEQQKRQATQQPNAIYANTGPGGVPNHSPPPYQSQNSSSRSQSRSRSRSRSDSESDSDSMRKSQDSLTGSNDGSYDYADSVIV